VYDNQTCSMLQTDQQFPSVSSQTRDFWSMPTARWMSILDPKLRSEKQLVQTIPDKGWIMILRLCGALEPWFNKTWRRGRSNSSRDLAITRALVSTTAIRTKRTNSVRSGLWLT